MDLVRSATNTFALLGIELPSSPLVEHDGYRVVWLWPQVALVMELGRQSGELATWFEPLGEVKKELGQSPRIYLDQIGDQEHFGRKPIRTQARLEEALRTTADNFARVADPYLRGDALAFAREAQRALVTGQRRWGAAPLWEAAVAAFQQKDWANTIEAYERAASDFPNVPLPPIHQRRLRYARLHARDS